MISYTQLVRIVGWSLMVGVWVVALTRSQMDLTDSVVTVGAMIVAAILIK